MADIKKFLNQDGVSILWSKIVEKVATDVKSETDRAVGVEQGLATSIENLENYVGTIPEGATATDVVAYIQEKTNGIATDTALGELQDAVDAIEADYLKAADKTELSNAISAVDGKADALAGKVGDVAEGKTVVSMIADAQAAATYDDTALAGRVTTLEGNDAGKSVRTIANEELAKQLVADDAKESLDTLAEIAAWIQSHPDDASAMNEAITALQNKVVLGTDSEGKEYTTVKAYVEAAIAALNVGQYALASELVTLAGRVTTIENDYLKAADKTELSNAIALKADATALAEVKATADAAAVKADVDAALALKAAQADLEAEAVLARAAEKANADAIAAIKDDSNIDSFADVVAALAGKQDTIPAETYDAHGAAAQALVDAKAYTDTEVAKIKALEPADIEAAIAAAAV